MTRGEDRPKGTGIQVERVSDGCGIRIWDPIEKVTVVLRTPSRIDVQRGSTDGFPFPVETAVEFRTDRIDIPAGMSFGAWDSSDVLRGTIQRGRGTWEPAFHVKYLELSNAPMRFYIGVDSSTTIETKNNSSRIDLEGNQRITVGVGSKYRFPEGTITVTDDPEDVMRAVSLFGSALDTLSPERSFPTLRGHPPLIERGDEFSTPSGLERPDTGVRLVVPPDREYVYPIVSLAYYLGAEVVPGNHPRLETPDSEYVFSDSSSFERDVNELLRHVFFMDCVTREEWFYSAPLHIRPEIESLVNFDFESLYDRSLSEQLDAYLDVPLDRVGPHFPDWYVTVALEPTTRNVEALPYVSSDLAFVRCPSPTACTPRTEPPRTVTDFCRSQTASGQTTEPMVVTPPETETVHDEWLAAGVPVGANKLSIDSYRRRVAEVEPKTSTITVKIVCNDQRMKSEERVAEMYDFREVTDYDIDIEYDLTVDDLATMFTTDIDFLHYIGHVTDEGIECTDGALDTHELGEVGVESFLLNACRSYHQSMALIENGCRGGIATLSEVSNTPATEVGSWLARLLGQGFSIRDALSIARTTTLSGDQYIVLGDPTTAVCRSFTVSNFSVEVALKESGVYSVTEELHLDRKNAGTTYYPGEEESERHYLSPETVRKEMTADELDELLNTDPMPVKYDGDLYWSDDITTKDLR
ncbi:MULTISPECIES: hypothetical protein [unclassified Haladaptatus]|uniref:hypothetical protein n=1 Tax=unclassified Haladaptatus TaxID=2622732 RepID=UPI00209C5C82|nr:MULTISPECIES: hypothetical protein [unclassified Haladaptatus]MCO8243982.1 hypothetical protein [Haladaptatus sp. AB643]MCO8256517.1 hypothetical protein [Haladaptatus sp. AB618]